jgi:hypothetical protein
MIKISKLKQDQILASIGLQLEANILSYEANHFTKYVSIEYLNSDRKQSDEIYRMDERTLLHLRSGLRLAYTITESYFGDSVEYKLIDIFIITPTQKHQEIVDVDFSKEVFYTPGEIVAFAEVDKGNE